MNGPDIVTLLKELEQKDKLLSQNDIELWEKTSKIKELEQALEKTQQSLTQQKNEFSAMEKRKDEMIANLEQHFYDGVDKKDIQILKDENQKLNDQIKDLQNKNNLLQAALQE